MTTLAGTEPFADAIAIDATNVYWATNTNPGFLKKVAKSGGMPVVLASGLNAPVAIAVDTQWVYVTTSGDQSISRVPINGGAPVVLATGQPSPDGVTFDATSLYWANDVAAPNGAVMKLTPK
jgi:hypothetical protein